MVCLHKFALWVDRFERQSILKVGARWFFTIESYTQVQKSGRDKTMTKQNQAPNIIIMYADDLGYGDVSCYGASRIDTPSIDRLANEGLLFWQGYATAATCTPSRYSLLTGSYPWRNPRAKILRGDAPQLIPSGSPTLPGMLQKAGYTTGVVGKWHLDVILGKQARGRNELVVEGNQGNTILRSGDWTFIPPREGHPVHESGYDLGNCPEPQLFDLSQDIGQMDNVADERADVVIQLSERLNEIITSKFTR